MSHIDKVQRKHFLLTLVTICIALLFSGTAMAEENLKDFHARLDSYLNAPLKRAKTLQEELNKINTCEKTLASGYGLPISLIYEQKATISKAIAEYYQLDSITTDAEKARISTLMPKSASKILSGSNFSTDDFVTLLKARHAYHKTISAYENNLRLKQEAYESANESLKKAEAAYRQITEKTDKKICSTWSKDKFELSKLKAEIEAQSTNMAICTLYSNLVKDTLQGFYTEFEDIQETVGKCLENPSRLIIQNDYFDSEVEQNITWCWDEYARILRERVEYKKVTPSSQTLATLEARLDEFEDADTILLLSLSENWSYLLRNWYYLFDIVKGVLPLSDTEQLNTYTEFALNFIKESSQIATAQMSSLKTMKSGISTLDTSKFTAKDKVILANISSRINRMLNRVDKYLLQLEEMEGQTQIIAETSNDLVDKTDKKTLYFAIFTAKAKSFFTAELFSVDEHPITIAKLLIAAILLVICHLISKHTSRRIEKLFASDTNKNIASLQKLASITIWFVTLLIILWQLKIPITAFAFIGGYGAIAIGIGMQRVLGNMIAGIILLVQKRIRVGDILTVEGKRGIVKEITLMNTILSCSLASEHVVIPNAKLLDISVLNHTLHDNFMRSTIAFWITGEKEVENIKAIMEDVIAKDESVVIKSRPYFIRVADFGANDSVKFEIAYFFDVTKFLVKDAEAVLREKVFTELRSRGIEVRDQDTVIQMVRES